MTARVGDVVAEGGRHLVRECRAKDHDVQLVVGRKMTPIGWTTHVDNPVDPRGLGCISRYCARDLHARIERSDLRAPGVKTPEVGEVGRLRCKSRQRRAASWAPAWLRVQGRIGNRDVDAFGIGDRRETAVDRVNRSLCRKRGSSRAHFRPGGAAPTRAVSRLGRGVVGLRKLEEGPSQVPTTARAQDLSVAPGRGPPSRARAPEEPMDTRADVDAAHERGRNRPQELGWRAVRSQPLVGFRGSRDLTRRPGCSPRAR